jgi:hypothetical protein
MTRKGAAMPLSTNRLAPCVPQEPSIEPLEPRLLLSGNIMASVIGGDLLVWGDAESNMSPSTRSG